MIACIQLAGCRVGKEPCYLLYAEALSLQPAFACAIQDGIFSEAYSAARAPFSPASFLYAWWQHADHHLAGYSQQDAHEFYLYALSGLAGPSPPEPKHEAIQAPAANGPFAPPLAFGGPPLLHGVSSKAILDLL